jgi:TPP-dependent 2-oxoacid decarboxylase
MSKNPFSLLNEEIEETEQSKQKTRASRITGEQVTQILKEYVEGRNPEEIAISVDLSEAQVNRKVVEARRVVKAQLKDETDEDKKSKLVTLLEKLEPRRINIKKKSESALSEALRNLLD